MEPREDPGLCCFVGLFEGVGEKESGSARFFAGEFVVDCVVIVVGWVVIIESEKYATEYEVSCGNLGIVRGRLIGDGRAFGRGERPRFLWRGGLRRVRR